MYLMGFVNSTFVTRRPTGNLELVDLSLENKFHPPESVERSKGLGDLRNGHSTAGSTIRNGYGRLTDTEIDGLRVLNGGEKETMSCNLRDAPSGLDPEWSLCTDKTLDMAQAEQFTNPQMTTNGKIRLRSKVGSVFTDGGVATRVQYHPLGMMGAEQDRGADAAIAISSGVPSDMIGRDINGESSPKIDDGFARVSQHPLERIEVGVMKDQTKLSTRNEERSGTAPSQKSGRKIVDGEQAQKPRHLGKPSLSSPLTMNGGASPEMMPYSWNPKFHNLSKLAVRGVDSDAPLMEQRVSRCSSPKLTQPDGHDKLSFRLWEQRESTSSLARKSISLSKAFHDLEDETHDMGDPKLSRASNSPRSCSSLSCESLGMEEDDVENGTRPTPEQLSPPNFEALVNLPTFDLRSRRKTDWDDRSCEESESQQNYPSPSSFTSGLSPSFSFLDYEEPFEMSESDVPDNMMFSRSIQQSPREKTSTLCKARSPRSVLSQEPDENSHSETRETDRQYASSATYLYNDDSSDLESPVEAHSVETEFGNGSFPAYTYNVGEDMGETSSDEDSGEARDSTPVDEYVTDFSESELQFYQEAKQLEPWLVNIDDGVLDDSDLKFLLPPNLKDEDTASVSASADAREQLVPETSTMQDSSPRRRPKCQNNWLPYVTGNNHVDPTSPARARGSLRRRHSKSSDVFVASLDRGVEKKKIPQRVHPKRSVNFAPELVKEIPVSTPNQLPVSRGPNPNAKHDHDDEEDKSPSVKTWKVDDEEGPSIMTSRRRWRKYQNQNLLAEPILVEKSTSWRCCEMRTSRRQRVAEVVPCAGKLFSWPRRLAFKVSRSRSRAKDSDNDDDGVAGGDQSFGMSARRDAEQVRRILKGSQKKYSNLSVDDIMKGDFG